ncbi:DsrE family protein [Fulvivirga sedimenti]|uniref:DsrE family protein n=1 Tax=Fulvivirga sedimenti TaxID=2879465 RepID=A0A9X1HRX7_9BACT|nr:DsrE family protein [Fulvivirga sedimenti]MCA6074894.1 DsrE family protein [Fulvivirga sedimenti]MCA6076071.1 DsrE family protein [Fulvivirga sedimenti]MCA6077199.1 DsrE family protein [Fulvivirga sedimenti]
MKKHFILLLLIIFSVALSQAQEIVFPAVQGYGGVNPVPFEAEKPDPAAQYKFVIELGHRYSDKTQVADMLDYAARMYNLHIYAGVPRENIQLAIVVYSSSTAIAMADATYSQRFDQTNPNAALLEELIRNGIQVIVCGQSMMKQNLLPGDIYPGIKMAVSRFTATTDLMGKGYKLFVL